MIVGILTGTAQGRTPQQAAGFLAFIQFVCLKKKVCRMYRAGSYDGLIHIDKVQMPVPTPAYFYRIRPRNVGNISIGAGLFLPPAQFYKGLSGVTGQNGFVAIGSQGRGRQSGQLEEDGIAFANALGTGNQQTVRPGRRGCPSV